MGFFTPETESPSSMLDVLVVPMLFLIFGIILYAASNKHREFTGSRPKWMPAVYLLIGLAFIFGLQLFAFTFDFIYANTLITRKLWIAHYLSFFAPVITILSMIGYEWKRNRDAKQRLY